MTAKRALSAVAIALVATLGATACGADAPANKDPRKGYVEIDQWTGKQCDGPNLIYYIGRGGNTIPNSPECQP